MVQQLFHPGESARQCGDDWRTLRFPSRRREWPPRKPAHSPREVRESIRIREKRSTAPGFLTIHLKETTNPGLSFRNDPTSILLQLGRLKDPGRMTGSPQDTGGFPVWELRPDGFLRDHGWRWRPQVEQPLRHSSGNQTSPWWSLPTPAPHQPSLPPDSPSRSVFSSA